MSTTHVSWPSIELFHNVVRTLTHLSELGRPFPKVEYRAKVKLHGTNCAVQRTDAGVIAQSRTTILSPGADYKGFAAWVQAQQAYFAALRPGTILFGEWCGPGVEKGMAISQLKAKVFAVFAAVIDGRVIYEPGELREIAPAAGAPPSCSSSPGRARRRWSTLALEPSSRRSRRRWSSAWWRSSGRILGSSAALGSRASVRAWCSIRSAWTAPRLAWSGRASPS